MKRLLTAGAAAILMMLALPAVSNAAPTDYPPSSTTGTSSPASTSTAASTSAQDLVPNTPAVTSGGTVTVFGSGYDPFEDVDIYSTQGTQALRAAGAAFVSAPAGTLVARVKADANGNFSVVLKLDQVGSAVVTAVGVTSGHVTTTTIQVEAVGAAVTTQAAGGLSYTGVNSTMITFGALGGGLALVIGAGLIWLGATKRRGSTHHA
jgi:hypothetical protein